MTIDHIGLAKAIIWEEVKGKLRALVAASGASPALSGRAQNYENTNTEVEKFIKDFENKGLHE